MSEIPAVSVKDVSFRYSGEPVLEHISFQVPQGDFLGIIGPNGSGKTTLLRIMLGLLKPEKGSVKLVGKVGYVPQKAGADLTKFPLTVDEAIRMVGGKKSVDFVLKMVGMEKYRRSLLSELSGGQQQRIFIARALATDPQLLILDEPTVGVDQMAQDQFYELLRHLNKHEKLTLILVSHDIDVIAHEVTNIVCLNCQIVYHGQPQDITEGMHEKLYGKRVRFIEHRHDHA